ncbi:tyrosine-type recombinase/integrase [Desulfogranum japonicum]|uniref:tyrosine-type recombinase/integrase n=1 Tax=Desulfogranum japonicum TaxID=231447 RepID=UPI000411B568|nr:integrase arm-type DNA-binding domain-containing protein [Desulfogranum japonicum]
MKLTDTAIRNAKPQQKQYKLTDGRGLYLLVTKTGKYFRWDYRFGGKRKTFAYGVYPDVTLKEVREWHTDYKRILAKGIDPNEYKNQEKRKQKALTENMFEVVAREWYSKQVPTWTAKHAETVKGRLENKVLPWIGNKEIASVDAPMLLKVLRRIENGGAIETAHRVKQICGQVFRYAIATGRADRDPSADLKGALTPVKPKAMATITDPKKIGCLMRAIDGYHGNLVTRCALKLAPLTFVRPGELRHAEWEEIDVEGGIWKIPESKMKMNRPHIVPLSRQSLEIIEEIRPLTGEGKYVFPSLRSRSKPMSNNTVNAALRGMGYSKDQITGHGFRGMASTLLYENAWLGDAIELQLAHAEGNSVKAAYNYAQHLEKRKDMMQWWADYLDELREDVEK